MPSAPFGYLSQPGKSAGTNFLSRRTGDAGQRTFAKGGYGERSSNHGKDPLPSGFFNRETVPVDPSAPTTLTTPGQNNIDPLVSQPVLTQYDNTPPDPSTKGFTANLSSTPPGTDSKTISNWSPTAGPADTSGLTPQNFLKGAKFGAQYTPPASVSSLPEGTPSTNVATGSDPIFNPGVTFNAKIPWESVVLANGQRDVYNPLNKQIYDPSGAAMSNLWEF